MEGDSRRSSQRAAALSPAPTGTNALKVLDCALGCCAPGLPGPLDPVVLARALLLLMRGCTAAISITQRTLIRVVLGRTVLNSTPAPQCRDQTIIAAPATSQKGLNARPESRETMVPSTPLFR